MGTITNMDETTIRRIASKTGFVMADASVGIGREIWHPRGPARAIVFEFDDSDVPEAYARILKAVFELETGWVFFARHGGLRAREFGEGQNEKLVAAVLDALPKILGEVDDRYVLSKSGRTLVTIDHHLFEGGSPIEFTDVALAGRAVVSLNALGPPETTLLSRFPRDEQSASTV